MKRVAKQFIGYLQIAVRGGHVVPLFILPLCGVLPSAVLCSNDMTAIGVMRQSYEEKIRIPDGLSVVGFDDIRMAQFMLPPLTSVQMSQAELARMAFHALLSDVRRDSPAPNGTEYVLKTNLVLRESTALAPGSPSRTRGNGKR